MTKWLNNMAAKTATYVSGLRKNERGDIVQTLMIIAIAVILVAIVYAALQGSVNTCINSGFTDCFGITG